jgi:D-psicose/D-tagatose/L-ribulose 3-epimerase
MKKPFKTSIHASVWGPRWDIAAIGPTLDAAAAIGYDHVVIPLRTFDGVDPPGLAREFTRRGLVPLNTAGVPADCDIGDRSNAVRRRGIARLCTAVSMARDMGSSQINGVLYGPLARATGPAEPEAFNRAADALATVAQHAAGAGVRLAVEVVNRYETNLLNTARRALDFVAAAGQDNIAIHLDTFHMSIEERSPLDALRAAISKLFYFELDQSHRGDLRAGSLDLERLTRFAAEAGYRGIVGVEAFCRSRMTPDHADALAVWHDAFGDADALAASAFALINRAFDYAV